MRLNGNIRDAAAGLAWLAALSLLTACGGEGPPSPGSGGIDEDAALLLRAGKVEEAEALLKGLDPDELKEPDALFCRGALAFREALNNSDPKSDPSLERAESLFMEVVSKDPSHYLANVSLGEVMRIQGELVEAVKTLDKAQKLCPDRADAYFGLARVYLESGELSAACDSVSIGLEKEPERGDGYMFLGDILIDYRGQPDEGLRAMRTALKLDPDLPGAAERVAELLLGMASRTLGQNKYDDTLRILEEVMALTPENMECIKLRGQVFDQTGRTDQALEEFRKYYNSDPSDDSARNIYARVLIKRGYQLLILDHREEALELFREAVALDAPDVDATFVSKILEEDEKAREREARKEKEKANMAEARALFLKASAMLEMGRAEEALNLLKRSLEILPDNPYTHHQAGIALDILDRPEEAEEELKLALRHAKAVNAKLPATYLKLAEITIKAERFQEGREYLDRHAELFPDQADSLAVKTLRRLLLLK